MNVSWKALTGAVFALSLVATVPALAQQEGPPRGGMGGGARMMEMLFKDITLTDAQKGQVEEIQAKYRKEMPPMTRGEMPDEASMAKRRELMTRQQDEIRGVLTPEQREVFDRNLEEMRSRRPGAGRPGRT